MNSQVPHLPNLTPSTSAAPDPLAQLQDIHLPAEVGLWPPAWGWWVLVVILIIAISALVFLIKQKKSRNAYRTLALAELNKLKTTFNEHQHSEYLQALSIILRRTALSGFGAQFNASLKGNEWLEWLDNQCPKTQARFSQGIGQVLLVGPYQKAPIFARDELHDLSVLWIKEHRNQWQHAKQHKKSIEAAHHV